MLSFSVNVIFCRHFWGIAQQLHNSKHYCVCKSCANWNKMGFAYKTGIKNCASLTKIHKGQLVCIDKTHKNIVLYGRRVVGEGTTTKEVFFTF